MQTFLSFFIAVFLTFGSSPSKADQRFVQIEDIEWFEDQSSDWFYEKGAEEFSEQFNGENIEWFNDIEPAAGSSFAFPSALLPEIVLALLPPEIITPAWMTHSVAFSAEPHKPMIAIVIDDMGLARQLSQKAVNLPSPLTFAYLPYADDLAEQTTGAHDLGHELLIHMPMEPSKSTQNPGPNALRVALSEADLETRLLKNLSAFTGYVGINNHMGSKMSKNHKGLSVVMRELKKRNLLYLDSRTTALSIGEQTAREHNVTTTHRDVFLDHEMTKDFVQKALLKTERYARKHGTAIAIGHPHKVTVDVLAKWLPKARAKGFQIVPLTTVVKKRLSEQPYDGSLVKASLR